MAEDKDDVKLRVAVAIFILRIADSGLVAPLDVQPSRKPPRHLPDGLAFDSLVNGFRADYLTLLNI